MLFGYEVPHGGERENLKALGLELKPPLCRSLPQQLWASDEMSHSLRFFLGRVGLVNISNWPSFLSVLSTAAYVSFLEHNSGHSIALLKTFQRLSSVLGKRQTPSSVGWLGPPSTQSPHFVLPFQPR